MPVVKNEYRQEADGEGLFRTSVHRAEGGSAAQRKVHGARRGRGLGAGGGALQPPAALARHRLTATARAGGDRDGCRPAEGGHSYGHRARTTSTTLTTRTTTAQREENV